MNALRRRRILYIFVEVGARELLSRLVLAEAARRRGYRVVLGEKNLVRNLCWLFRAPPGIILDKCGQISRSYPIRALKSRGFRYVVLDEEGFFFSHSNRLPDPQDLMLFNNAYQQRLANRGAPASDVVGNPRLHPRQLLPYLQDQLQAIRERYGEFILICSSFDPRIKSSYVDPQEAVLDATYRKLFLEIIERLRKSVPIVFRPHPSDGEEFAEQVAQFVPVERRFTILPWIAASRLVVNAKCTSSFEAVRLGVPSATLSLKTRAHTRLNALSRRFYDVESLCRYVETGQYSTQLPAYKRNYIALVSGPDDPETRLLDRIETLDAPEVAPFSHAAWTAGIMQLINRMVYGRASSRSIVIKYGHHGYERRFPHFSSHLQGRLIVSRD
jgi:surface carbohydrate biosynthesis protein